MEQHPVPRNITGFQFHLIGDMTVKQFGELLAGVILGYISIKLPLPTFLSWPLGTVFALSGVAFAFLPIQERPLDRWLVAFLHSVYSPTQFLWQKRNNPPTVLQMDTKKPTTIVRPSPIPQLEESRQKLQAYLATLPKRPHETIDTNEAQRLKQMAALFASSPQLQPATPLYDHSNLPVLKKPLIQVPTTQQPATTSHLPPAQSYTTTAQTQLRPAPPMIPTASSIRPTTGQTPQPPASPLPSHTGVVTENYHPPAEETRVLGEQIQKIQTELAQDHVPKERFVALEGRLVELNAERERLANELATLKRSLVSEHAQPTTTTKPPTPQLSTPQTSPLSPFSALSRTTTKPQMPSTPQVPNIISGIIKDREGNLLPNIIVTVKDKNGIPQRALKSNRLGQFASSSPLTSGSYTIEVEDPQKIYIFDIIQVVLNDVMTQPLELLAKSQKEVDRERLMKEVFGR